MKKTVLVLGQARSGTSMTAGLLNILGVNLGHSNNPSSQNPKGAFENVTFNTMTSKMHLDLKADMDSKTFNAKYKIDILDVIRKRNAESDFWGWKSALTHFSLDYWLPHLINPHFVVVTRNPYHNALSWQKHKKEIYKEEVSVDEAIKIICESVVVLISALNKHKTVPKIYTTYEDIKSQPVMEIVKIGKFLGLNPGKNKKDRASELIMSSYSTIKGN